MNEPASLFDTGMFRLQREAFLWNEAQQIRELREKLQATSGFYPIYNFEQNRILVIAHLFNFDSILENPRAMCRWLIEFMSTQAHVDSNTGKPTTFTHPETGKPMPEVGATSTFSQHFQHLGYVNKDAPSDYLSRLDFIFLLKGIVGDAPQQTTCQRDLLSNKVYFEE